MSRFAQVLGIGVVMALTNLLLPWSQTVPTGQAAAPSGPADLAGTALNYGAANEDAAVFLTNTDGSTTIRALVVARDTSGSLVGCAMRTLRPGERTTIYILGSASSPAQFDQNVLQVTALGLAADGALAAKAQSQRGLAGQMAQLDQASGATRSLTPMIEFSATGTERQTQINECMGPGAPGALGGGGSIMSTDQPPKWFNANTKRS